MAPTMLAGPSASTAASSKSSGVRDVLYPEVLKIAAHDIGNFDFPIAVY
jgi:hypothetical protein